MEKKNHISSTYLTKCRISARNNLVKIQYFIPQGFLQLKQHTLVYECGIYQSIVFLLVKALGKEIFIKILKLTLFLSNFE